MRPIKFRAWDHRKKNWITCDLKTGFTLTISKGQHNRDEMNPWQQFTGLLDKNGLEIYEGDIVQDDGNFPDGVEYMSRVVFFHDRFIGDLTPFGEGRHISISEFAEVIGNIHENPELLK